MTAPILWWKAENNAVDSVLGLAGTWRGTAAYTTGIVGNAFSFNGSSSINVANNAAFMFDPNGQFSVRCWFKTANWDDTRGIVAVGNDGNQWDWYIAVFNQRVVISVRGVSNSSTPAQPMAYNTWYDLLVTYNNGGWNVYFDGATTPVLTLSNKKIRYDVVTPTLDIGTIASRGGRINGAIDEVRFYDQVITLGNQDVPVIVPVTRTFIDIVEETIQNNSVGQFFLQYGTPTITLSSNGLQLVSHNGFDEVDSFFLDDDLELLIGSK